MFQTYFELEWKNLSLVCKAWKKLVTQILQDRKIVTLNWPISKFFDSSLSKALEHFQRPCQLHLDFQLELPEISGNFQSSIKTLIVKSHHTTTKFTQDYLLFLLQRLRNLQEISIKSDVMTTEIMGAMTTLSNLQSLEYTVSRDWKDYLPLHVNLCNQSSSLTHIGLIAPSFGRYFPVSSTDLESLGKSFTNITSLNLQGLWQGCEEILSNIKSPRLRQLKLYQSFFSQHLDEKLAIFFNAHKSSLTSVYIHGNWRGCYTDWPRDLLQPLSDISHLGFTSTDIFVNSNCLLISKFCKQLVTLEIKTYTCDELEIVTLDTLYSSCSLLQSITIYPLATGNSSTECTRRKNSFTLQKKENS